MIDTQPSQEEPDAFPVAVLMTRRPSANRWVSHTWKVTGVVVSSQPGTVTAAGTCVRTGADGEEDFLWGGFRVRLYKDEAESYYYNLLSDNPSLFVITRTDDQGRPRPFLVSACFDEAGAYLEGGDDAQAVPMPPELYNWVERFVLAHYVPERKTKRKRKNWKEGERD